jgi:hypothetical protein
MVEGPPTSEPRKIRLGLIIMGAVLAIALALAVAVDDPVGRFIFGFVAVACVVQLWRLGRLMRRSR